MYISVKEITWDLLDTSHEFSECGMDLLCLLLTKFQMAKCGCIQITIKNIHLCLLSSITQWNLAFPFRSASWNEIVKILPHDYSVTMHSYTSNISTSKMTKQRMCTTLYSIWFFVQFLPFIINSLPLSNPNRGRGSSLNLVVIWKWNYTMSYWL